jgi:hypothetical protein
MSASPAEAPNEALKPFTRSIGTSSTTGTRPLVPNVIRQRRSVFEWINGGALLLMRTSTVEPQIPDGIAIFGTHDALSMVSMLYFDERGASRRYDVSMNGGVMRWWREAPGFSQRFTCAMAADGETMEGRGELSRDGRTWEPDIAVSYARQRA